MKTLNHFFSSRHYSIFGTLDKVTAEKFAKYIISKKKKHQETIDIM